MRPSVQNAAEKKPLPNGAICTIPSGKSLGGASIETSLTQSAPTVNTENLVKRTWRSIKDYFTKDRTLSSDVVSVSITRHNEKGVLYRFTLEGDDAEEWGFLLLNNWMESVELRERMTKLKEKWKIEKV